MFSCGVCDKTFTLISNLRRHAKSHDAPNKISCSICLEIFTRRDNLIRHRKEKHRKYYFFSQYKNLLDKIFINNLIIIIILFSGSNIIIQQQPTITKREIQDFLKPTEQIYDYNGKYLIQNFIYNLDNRILLYKIIQHHVEI